MRFATGLIQCGFAAYISLSLRALDLLELNHISDMAESSVGIQTKLAGLTAMLSSGQVSLDAFKRLVNLLGNPPGGPSTAVGNEPVTHADANT